ncbi:MAG: formyltetrahydrofolate deformylase [Leptospiraceae bacterium]|nr:formyltetrahydrofolate deformylase [Leptospiraceae bacterium]MCP5500394.1 formyltetrahydrofolate deformylase [Leptospiraceae bacterium]
MKDFILRVKCRDELGLLNRITSALLSRQLNIVSNSEFVDPIHNLFFVRTEFTGDINESSLLSELRDKLPENALIQLNSKERKKLIILVTKENHCLGDLLIRWDGGDLNADILGVISNHNQLQNLSEKFGLPFHYITHEEKTREIHEAEISSIIQQYNPDYIILAKYMRILTESFVDKFPGKIINIHHSFLPAFIGAKPYQQAFDRGVKIIGATAHFVTKQLDDGPIIHQATSSITHRDSAEEMAKQGRDIEKLVLAKAVKLVLEDRVFISGNKTIIFE